MKERTQESSDMDIDAQIELEKLFHKNQTIPLLTRYFNILQVQAHLDKNQIPEAWGINFLIQMVLHKRTLPGVMIGILLGYTPNKDPAAGAKLLEKAVRANLAFWDGKRLILRHDVPEDVRERLETFQYPLPMVVEPEEIRHNFVTGYVTEEVAYGSVILNGGWSEEDVCLDHLDRVNRIPLKINASIIHRIKNSWKHVLRPKPGEDDKTFLQRSKSFKKYNQISSEIFKSLLMFGNRFWLTHKYDRRGRCYSQGYHVNPQGNDWNKASWEFANQKRVIG